MSTTVEFLEHDSQRLRRRLKAIGGGHFSSDELASLVAGDLSVVKGKPRRIRRAVVPLVKDARGQVRGQLEQIVGESLDLVPVSYVTSARQAASAVCRIVSQDRKAKGTGVLVAPGVLLTNHHVISDDKEAVENLAQLNYELDRTNQPLPTIEFALNPGQFFWTSPVGELDVTLVAVGDAQSGDKSMDIEAFGVCSLSAADDKHAAGDYVTVVQHPDGDYKQIALRDNRVLGRGKGGVTLHYASDTLPGSSGSPVFNDEFVLVALHHAGGPRLESTFDSGEVVPAESNEGIRVSSIVSKLQEASASPAEHQAETIASILGTL